MKFPGPVGFQPVLLYNGRPYIFFSPISVLKGFDGDHVLL